MDSTLELAPIRPHPVSPARLIRAVTTSWLAQIALLSISALGQFASGPFSVGNEAGRLGVEGSLRVDPPSSPLGQMFTALSRSRSVTNGPTFYSRIFFDKMNHTYLGYELLIEQRQLGEYLVTFGRLGVTPLDLAATILPTHSPSSPDTPNPTNVAWTMLSLPGIPNPRTIRDGDIVSIVLFVEAGTGVTLIEDIRVNRQSPTSGVVPQVPTVSGSARNFLVADAELQIVQPQITFDRKVQATHGPGFRNVRGSLVWLYLPEHGRFIMALMPRAVLGFRKAGEVRGGLLAFALGGHSIKLECLRPIATGHSAYNLYVLHDEDWEPTAEGQKHLPALGTVSAAELTALRGK